MDGSSCSASWSQDGVDLLAVKSPYLRTEHSRLHPREKTLNISWTTNTPLDIAEETSLLFTLELEVKTPILISELFELNPRRLRSEAYQKEQIKALLLQSITEVKAEGIRLDQNFPNPFKEKTSFLLHLSKQENIHIQVFDLQGRLINTSRQSLGKGTHQLNVEGQGLNGPGVYIFRGDNGREQVQRRMIYF